MSSEAGSSYLPKFATYLFTTEESATLENIVAAESAISLHELQKIYLENHKQTSPSDLSESCISFSSYFPFSKNILYAKLMD